MQIFESKISIFIFNIKHIKLIKDLERNSYLPYKNSQIFKNMYLLYISNFDWSQSHH